LRPQIKLRVAIGQAVGGYVGTSIELQGVQSRDRMQLEKLLGHRAYVILALVETIPAGAEGTLTPRNLIRNTINPVWDVRDQLSKKEHVNQQKDPMIGRAFYEFRPMRIPEGAQVDRLRVVGWMEDRRGNVLTAAVSDCQN
jgi:hypothetical protein